MKRRSTVLCAIGLVVRLGASESMAAEQNVPGTCTPQTVFQGLRESTTLRFVSPAGPDIEHTISVYRAEGYGIPSGAGAFRDARSDADGVVSYTFNTHNMSEGEHFVIAKPRGGPRKDDYFFIPKEYGDPENPLVIVVHPVISAKGLVAHYTFDEGAGAQAKNASRAGNDGEIHGATFIKGPRGHALQFDGVDDFVDCGIVPGMGKIGGAGTIEFWVKPEAFQGELVSWRTGEAPADQRIVTAFKTTGHTIDLVYAEGDGSRASEYRLEPPEKGAWNHVVLTFNSGAITYYLDGEERQIFKPSVLRKTEHAPLRLGKSRGPGSPYFKGAMDEVRIFSRALPPVEILSRYRSQSPSFGKARSIGRIRSYGQRPCLTPGS